MPTSYGHPHLPVPYIFWNLLLPGKPIYQVTMDLWFQTYGEKSEDVGDMEIPIAMLGGASGCHREQSRIEYRPTTLAGNFVGKLDPGLPPPLK